MKQPQVYSRKSSPITFCHWNLNGLTVHGFIKVHLKEAFISTHSCNFYEIFLDSTIDLDNGNGNIAGYSILRADNHSNRKRGDVCIYFKQFLQPIRRDNLSKIQEIIVAEISVEKSFANFYRSPSQDYDKLDKSCSELNLLLANKNNNKSASSILIYDFNATCSKWCIRDKNNTAGHEIHNIVTMTGYSQVKNKPTHFTSGTSYYIDLILSSNMSFIRNYGIKQSIFRKCHHNIRIKNTSKNCWWRNECFQKL